MAPRSPAMLIMLAMKSKSGGPACGGAYWVAHSTRGGR
jgi:hypothetical protein